jgi:YVTN family beta-propeller protein
MTSRPTTSWVTPRRMAALAAAALLAAGCRSAGSDGSPAATVSAVRAASGAGSGSTATGTATGAGTPSGTTGSTGPTVDVYAADRAGMLSPVARLAKPLVYVPDTLANLVDVIDPRTYRVIRTIKVSSVPQHIVPSWDLKTLWVNESGGDRLTPINPVTGLPGKPVKVADPYNLYFTPDGKHALVMAERLRRIDFRDPRTMKLQHSLPVPCRGVNHADFTASSGAFLVSCEYSGMLLAIPHDGSRVAGRIDLNAIPTPGALSPDVARSTPGPAKLLDPGASSMPQDVRLSPDGSTFLVADLLRNGVWLVDSARFQVRGFVHTGAGAHGIYPSRDGTAIYVTNRDGGSVSVLDGRTLQVRATWVLPGGGSPDMGGVNADGSQLWVSGRDDSVVYVINTRSGQLARRIGVHAGPHGICVWPQPGRFSLGHTANLR